MTLPFSLYFSDSKSNGGKRSSKKMDSLTSAPKTNETSANAATLEDNQEAQNTQKNSSATTTEETLKHGSNFFVKLSNRLNYGITLE